MSGPDQEENPEPAAPPIRMTAAAAEEVYGAAAERTALAWQRTGLAIMVGCFVIFVASVRLSTFPIGVAAAALGMLVAASSVVGLHGDSYLRRGPAAGSWPPLVTVGASVTALGVLAAVASSLPLFY